MIAKWVWFIYEVSVESRRGKLPNNVIRDKCGMKMTVTELYERSSLRWFGHIERVHEKRAIKGLYMHRLSGKPGRGRLPKRGV